MTNSFLTLEDVNGILFSNQGFWWHEVDTALIDPDGTAEFTDIKVDFLTISKYTYNEDNWMYEIHIHNSLRTNGRCPLNKNGDEIQRNMVGNLSDGFRVTFPKSDDESPIKILVYLGPLGTTSYSGYYFLKNDNLSLNLKQLKEEQDIGVGDWRYPDTTYITSVLLNKGYNEIKFRSLSAGYLLVKLIKTDFQFQCNQQLTVGEVNTVQLGTATDYKPNGDLVGEYTTKLSVLYNDKTIPVVWNSQLNDYTFDLDLTDKTTEGKIRFKVIVEANEVLNASETFVSLNCTYEAINTVSKLTNLFNRGGVGRITSNITLTDDLTLSKSVYLISDGKTLTMDSHKIIVPSDKTFKATNLNFTGGNNTIQQNTNSKVELNNCSFTNCTGLGSVIDCQIDVNSLNNLDDFTTILNGCTFTNNDLCILHGGDLTVTDCTVNGKATIANKDYAYFLYQTDGSAVILQSHFNISSASAFDEDLMFNPCIFTCGETALINGHSHTELQVNNLLDFFETQRNTSSIDLTYKYSLINDYIQLKSDKGFCHSVSSVDYVFKTNVTPERI